MDVSAPITEDRFFLKIYQIPSFGVRVDTNVDLQLARRLSTRPPLEYLNDKVRTDTIMDGYKAFTSYLQDAKTDVFYGKFGEKYDTKNSDFEVYKGFYRLSLETKNMLFFLEQV